MGSTSTQGVALLVFLTGFTCLGVAMLFDANFLLLLLGVVGVGVSIPLFLKAKSMESDA